MNRKIAAVLGGLALALPLTFPVAAQADPVVEPPHAALDSHGNGLCRALPADTQAIAWGTTDAGRVVAWSLPDGNHVWDYGIHPCIKAHADLATAREHGKTLQRRIDRKNLRIDRLVARVERLRDRLEARR